MEPGRGQTRGAASVTAGVEPGASREETEVLKISVEGLGWPEAPGDVWGGAGPPRENSGSVSLIQWLLA